MSVVIAVVLLLATVIDANVARAAEQKTQSVTLHKLLMTNQDLEAWDANGPKGYDGTQNLEALKQLMAGKNITEIAGIEFVWKNEQGQMVNAQGQVVQNFDQALHGKTTQTGHKFNTSQLPAGTYLIDEVKDKSDRSDLTKSKAVPVKITLPLRNERGVVKDAHVYPKNVSDKPKMDKDFARGFGGSQGANVDQERNKEVPAPTGIGAKVPYEVKTQVPVKANYKRMVWSDIMTKGLRFNDDIVVKLGETVLPADKYEKSSTEVGFKIKLKPEAIDMVKNQAANNPLMITITYPATVTGDAVPNKVEENKVKFDYNNKNEFDSEPIPTNPTNGNLSVNKTFDVPAEGDLEIKYYLMEKVEGGKDKLVEVVTKQANNAAHTFNNLDNAKKYYVVEFSKGYQAVYGESTAGNINIQNKKNPDEIVPKDPKVKIFDVKFVKTNEENKRLGQAEFIVKKDNEDKYLSVKGTKAREADKTAFDQAERAYKEKIKAFDALSQTDKEGQKGTAIKAELEPLKVARDKAFKAVSINFNWVDDKAQAATFTSNDKGQFEIVGLEKGNYKLVETKAPQGYALLPDAIPFTVTDGANPNYNIKYQEDAQGANDAQKVINRKLSIPQTGGKGSTIFTIAGVAVIVAAILTKKRKKAVQ